VVTNEAEIIELVTAVRRTVPTCTTGRDDLLLGISTVLERAFNWSKHHGTVILLTGSQTRRSCAPRTVTGGSPGSISRS
jgi:hypothetical protein